MYYIYIYIYIYIHTLAISGVIAGTIFFYTRNDDGTWTDRGKTGAGLWGRSAANLFVGYSVAQDNSYQAAGAPLESSNKGAVYVRQVTTTATTAKGYVVESDTSSGSYFGQAVALSWPYLAVGAPGHSPQGAAFLYTYNEQSSTWTKTGSRIDPAAVSMSTLEFGRAVAVADGVVLVGGSSRCPTVFIFDANCVHL